MHLNTFALPLCAAEIGGQPVGTPGVFDGIRCSVGLLDRSDHCVDLGGSDEHTKGGRVGGSLR